MNTSTNVALQAVATGLVAVGVETVKTNFWQGVVIVLLGVIVYGVYEYFPSK